MILPAIQVHYDDPEREVDEDECPLDANEIRRGRAVVTCVRIVHEIIGDQVVGNTSDEQAGDAQQMTVMVIAKLLESISIQRSST